MYYYMYDGLVIWEDYPGNKLICVYVIDTKAARCGNDTIISRSNIDHYISENMAMKSEDINEIIGFIALEKL